MLVLFFLLKYYTATAGHSKEFQKRSPFSVKARISLIAHNVLICTPIWDALLWSWYLNFVDMYFEAKGPDKSMTEYWMWLLLYIESADSVVPVNIFESIRC